MKRGKKMKVHFENSFVSSEELRGYAGAIQDAHNKLYEKTGEGSDFLGWLNLRLDNMELHKIKDAAKKIREKSDVLVVIGIGGSYLGARAVIEALSHHFNPKNVIFAGNNDFPRSVPLGDKDSRDEKNFYGALNIMLSGLRDKYPKGEFLFVTPLKM